MGLQQGEDLELCLSVAVDAAKKAGQVILNSFHKAKAVELKGMHDLVTETDKACEEAIFKQLREAFESHKFIGEETSSIDGIPLLTDAPTWVVDPLDGTTNFVHRFPFVCVSIGLVINKVPVVGVVYNPILDELFTGIEGKGAFLNGERIYGEYSESALLGVLDLALIYIWRRQQKEQFRTQVSNPRFTLAMPLTCENAQVEFYGASKL
ncbi:hypothetical protein M758_11G011800 [Ceratodon purpureus]|nr:hypothetical protein M758_11G011800 [Ceratodon purpureus]KAG0600165.1 hypothetical protein M758_11G011800 [Ceratodon purpureus]